MPTEIEVVPAQSARNAGELVARSPAMRRLLAIADRAARTEATVLVRGESGTGKERLARFIHEHSARRKGRFVAINCAALPEPLLESELFGHRKGAFTGAAADTKGLFETAAGGTLFLDEIGEATPALQVRLLRALQERTVRPVGSTKDVAVDTRIIAATNRDLEALVGEKQFRRDLYYRLRVVSLEIPALRERREDLLSLARLFISRTCGDNRCGPCSLSSEVLDVLAEYDWPGNVRELENAIERAVILAEDQPMVRVQDLPPEIRARRAPSAAGGNAIATLAEIERRHILESLDRLGGNRKKTARALDIGENTLHRKLRSYGIRSSR